MSRVTSVRRAVADHPAPTPLPTPCRLWQGVLTPSGYGMFWHGGRTQGPHRWVVEQVGFDQYGTEWDPELMVMHLCDNPPCFRYDHLRLGTNSDNQRDAHAKGRGAMHNLDGAPRPRGEQHGHAKLTEAQVADIRSRLAAGEAGKALADQYGVSQSLISLIKSRRVWT